MRYEIEWEVIRMDIIDCIRTEITDQNHIFVYDQDNNTKATEQEVDLSDKAFWVMVEDILETLMDEINSEDPEQKGGRRIHFEYREAAKRAASTRKSMKELPL